MRILSLSLLFLTSLQLFAQDYAQRLSVRLEAYTNLDKNELTLTWNDDLLASKYEIHRRKYGSQTWELLASVNAANTSYVDATLTEGVVYEYLVNKLMATGIVGFGHILSGLNTKPIHHYGHLILAVELALFDSLNLEIERLKTDIMADGWTVELMKVSSVSSVVDLKDDITSIYKAKPETSGLILLGNLPIAYSGEMAPDGHTGDHFGAWPSDAFFADLDGTWTDKTVNNVTASRAENKNEPFDGKYDQNIIPSLPELMVGRIYLEKFTKEEGFTESRITLYKRYLDKNHAYRMGELPQPEKALVTNGLPKLSEGFAAMPFRYFGPMVGLESIDESEFETSLKSESYLYSYACGFGTYQGSKSISNVQAYSQDTFNSIFMGLLGSYFGDWDSENNFLRAPLAGKNPTLATFWSGRPNWYLHEHAYGLPIGYSLKSTQSANLDLGSIDNSLFPGHVHIALMGDPSLRIRYRKPVENFKVTSTDKVRVKLSWNQGQKDVLGYYIYRAEHADSSYALLNQIPIQEASFIDSFPLNDFNSYQVRAVYADGQFTGGYQNISLGTYDTISGINPIYVHRKQQHNPSETLVIFPNPASDFLYIKSDNQSSSYTFEIMNSSGQLVLQGNIAKSTTFGKKVDIANLNKGLYVINFNNHSSAPKARSFIKL